MPSDDRLNLSRTSRTAFGMIDRFPEVFRRIRSRNRTGGSTPRLNEQLEVAIVEDDLRLRFAFHPSVTASALHLCVKDRKDVPLLTLPLDGANAGAATLSLGECAAALLATLHDSDAQQVPGSPSTTDDRYKVIGRLYIDVERPGRLDPDMREQARIQLGNFADTSIPVSIPRPVGDDVLTVFAGRRLTVDLVVASEESFPSTYSRVVRWKRSRSSVGVIAELSTGSFALESADLVLQGRKFGERLVVPLEIMPIRDGARSTVRFTYRLSAKIPRDLVPEQLSLPDRLDAHIECRYEGHENEQLVALRRLAPLAQLTLPTILSKSASAQQGGELRAYQTFKARSLAFEFTPVEPDAISRIRWAPALSALATLTRRRNIWIVGERAETAQENGLELFRYLRDAHPEIESYYVISRDSPDLERVLELGNVLFKGSRQHVGAMLRARRIFSSHHAEYLFPAHSSAFERSVRAPRVFMQHGVMGTKNMVANYGFDAPEFGAEAFLVSSQREFEMITSDFGWPADRVFITGLSRFDRLFTESKARPVDEVVLVMPTWRDWLQRQEGFLDSEYYERWNELLTSDEFLGFLSTNSLTAELYLHSNMQAFVDAFDGPDLDERIRIVRPGDASVQDLLIRSKVMITDYTSAALDFSFLDKQVVYYQFDRSKFIGPKGSHFMLDEELPGFICFGQAAVIDALQQTQQSGFAIQPDHRTRASNLLAYRDTNARERIVHVGQGHLRAPRRRSRYSGHWQRGVNKVRRTRTYRRAGQRVYDLGRLLPTLRPLVVFESNLGRDAGDSPGAIFHSLRLRHPGVKTAWVRQATCPPIEGAENLVKNRLWYYWRLSRATVWISNQNRAIALERPARTFYLQTWHGTPLKRMLHDLDTTVGRDEGYIGRVDHMISQWSALLSPSPWASDRFRSAFQFGGPMLELGYPRNDCLVDGTADTLRKDVVRRLGLSRSQHTVMFAPTFRDDQKTGSRFHFHTDLDLTRLSDETEGRYHLLLRAHPIVSLRGFLPGAWRNVTSGYDTQELLCATDILITDYSSTMFDFLNLRRPMILFVPDLDRYRDETRGFYLDFESMAPGPLCRTTDEVLTYLNEPELLEAWDEQRELLRAQFCPRDDGHAADRVADYLAQTCGWV